MTRIDLVTGILGSGKTTFIRKYAKFLLEKGMKIAILENDFGAVNIDMMMLQDMRSDRCQLEMVSGGCDSDCHKRRFKTQLIALGMQKFDRVIVEPSGIFDMDEFFDTLHESPIDRWFEIGSIITVVDSEMEDELSEQMEFLLASEVSCCGRIVLSKTDNIDNQDAVKGRILEHINRSLESVKCSRRICEKDVICAENGKFSESDFGILMNSSYRVSDYVKKYTLEDIQSSVHYFMNIQISENNLESVLERIMNDGECGIIFRIKGAVYTGGKWLKINIAKDKKEITEVFEGQSVIIVIGDDINREKIDSFISEFNSNSEYVSI